MSNNKTAITPTRADDFAKWYQEVIKAADLAEHSAVRGCMIIKPKGYAIWENIQSNLDYMIKETGHQNVYFPMLIPLSFFEKEAEHVAGFAKECAVVTHYRLVEDGHGKLKVDPEAQLTEPYVIRPTSETVIGDAMSQWVQSYNDLPVLVNQWCNIMRWEMRTRLFLRTAEFLWQEGHTAHSSENEAREETLKMLDVYETLAQDFMAIPVIKGEKTPSERFPGASNTYTIEAMMQDGKALQAGTSHFLGQNFSKAYEIKYLDQNQQLNFAWTTSWGVSTRLIGALIMTHSDDDGLVIPPRIAQEHIQIIPMAMKEEDKVLVTEYVETLKNQLKNISYHDQKIRVAIDNTEKRAGDKFWQSVKRGTPIRIEIGAREVAANQITLSQRNLPAKEKTTITKDELLETIVKRLDDIQLDLFTKAKAFQQKNIIEINELSQLEKMFASDDENQKNQFALAYFDVDQEEKYLEKLKSLKITSRCIPFAMQKGEGVCIFSGNKTQHKVIFARAY